MGGRTYELTVRCRAVADGWTCDVQVGADRGAPSHEVTVTHDDLGRFAPGQADATTLVRESFRFLLEREPRESILRRFDLSVIGRYFPDFPAEIRARMALLPSEP